MSGSRARRRSSSDESLTDRSTPKSRPRTRTYDDHSDSYSTDYSDDFESDHKRSVTPPRRKRQDAVFKKSTGRPYASSQSSSVTLRSSGITKKTTTPRRGNYRPTQKSSTIKQVWRSNTSGAKRSPRRPIQDVITKHMLIAKQGEINEIQNRLHTIKQKLEAAEKENKVLKTLQRRQDKAIRRYESAEDNLPRLISQNFEDQRVLKARLRRTQEAEKALESKLRANNDEMQKMEATLKKLKSVVYDKTLGERSELSTQLTDAENGLHLANRKVTDLDKKLELTVNSLTRQLNMECLKHKETRDRMEMLREEYKTMDARLRERERALDVSNIYSHRKSPGKALLAIEAPKSPPSRGLLLSSETQTDLALTLLPHDAVANGAHVYVSKMTTPPSAHSLSNGSGSPLQSPSINAPKAGNDVKKRSKGGQSVFLTANFDSTLSSPSSSFITDSSGFAEIGNDETSPHLKAQHMRAPPKQDQKIEKERQKLEAEKEQKAKLLSRMKEIENQANQPLLEDVRSKSRTSSFSSSLKTKPDFVRYLLRTDSAEEDGMQGVPFGKPPEPKPEEMKPRREISFGGYAPTVGGVPRRKGKAKENSPKRSSPESGDDVPLFDLNSGKQNKKSDLLTQLFGHQEKPNLVLASGDSSTE